MLPQYNPVQVAYFVNDIREAASKMAAITGAGPFFILENVELQWSEHRNTPCDFVHSSAYGQWGDIMLEFVQQENDGPSAFRDMYAGGEEGIHHVACFVDSIDDTLELYEGLAVVGRSCLRCRAICGVDQAHEIGEQGAQDVVVSPRVTVSFECDGTV